MKKKMTRREIELKALLGLSEARCANLVNQLDVLHRECRRYKDQAAHKIFSRCKLETDFANAQKDLDERNKELSYVRHILELANKQNKDREIANDELRTRFNRLQREFIVSQSHVKRLLSCVNSLGASLAEELE